MAGPWLEHAREAQPDGDVLMLRTGGGLGPPAPAGTVSPGVVTGNYQATIGSGVRTLRRAYAPVEAGDDQSEQFLLAAGYQRVPELDVDDRGHIVRCFTVDHGPGGARARPATPSTSAVDARRRRSRATRRRPMPDNSAVRDALRSFHDPLALASSPLATGATVDERALMVQDLLRRATMAAFGESEEERLQRSTIERGYLDTDGGHARALAELHMSRATYYRRLKAASDRLGTYISAAP